MCPCSIRLGADSPFDRGMIMVAEEPLLNEAESLVAAALLDTWTLPRSSSRSLKKVNRKKSPKGALAQGLELPYIP